MVSFLHFPDLRNSHFLPSFCTIYILLRLSVSIRSTFPSMITALQDYRNIFITKNYKAIHMKFNIQQHAGNLPYSIYMSTPRLKSWVSSFHLFELTDFLYHLPWSQNRALWYQSQRLLLHQLQATDYFFLCQLS